MKRILTSLILVAIALAALGSQDGAKLPPKIDYAGLRALLDRPNSGLLLLDVRTAEEYRAGHIRGAALAPYDELPASFSEKDRNRPIVVYCRSGRRSAIAKASLEKMGYTQVSDFGAIDAWKGPLVSGD
jgi:rhodanese-related sulfurtransferase